MNYEVITLAVSIILGIIGYLITYFINLRISQRNDRLNRVNRQLGELYGPLFAISQSTDRTWKAFRKKYRSIRRDNKDGDPYSEEELSIWRLWMCTIFMPNNLRMYELILKNSDLLIESEMPQCLLDFCAHVTAYQIVIKRWENNDFSEHTSVVDYPTIDIIEYIQSSYISLKITQSKLLGKR